MSGRKPTKSIRAALEHPSRGNKAGGGGPRGAGPEAGQHGGQGWACGDTMGKLLAPRDGGSWKQGNQNRGKQEKGAGIAGRSLLSEWWRTSTGTKAQVPALQRVLEAWLAVFPLHLFAFLLLVFPPFFQAAAKNHRKSMSLKVICPSCGDFNCSGDSRSGSRGRL